LRDGEEQEGSHSSSFAGGSGERDGSVRLMYDFATLDVDLMILGVWIAEEMLNTDIFDLPFALDRPIVVKTACKRLELTLDGGLKELERIRMGGRIGIELRLLGGRRKREKLRWRRWKLSDGEA
jgi:hypothetical protein